MTTAVTAAFALYTALVHLLAGQRRVVAPLEASALAPFSRSTLFVVWHMVSFLLVSSAVALALGGEAMDSPLRLLLGAQLGFAAALFLVRGQRAHGGGFLLPQWLLLGPLAVAVVAPAQAAPLVLLAMALTHLAWALGLAWPSPSRQEAPRYLIGWPAGRRGPWRGATLVVVAVLVAMAWAASRGPAAAALATAAVLGARGLFGLVERRLRPGIAGTPYRPLSALFYSPLCLFLAALVLAQAARRSGW